MHANKSAPKNKDPAAKTLAQQVLLFTEIKIGCDDLRVMEICKSPAFTDPNWKNQIGDGYLHTAVRYLNLQVIHALVENGVNINQLNRFNQTPLELAAKMVTLYMEPSTDKVPAALRMVRLITNEMELSIQSPKRR